MTQFVSDDPEANLELSIRIICTLSFIVLAGWLWYYQTNVVTLREAEPSERFRFCRQLTINLCLMSAVLGIVQISELDDIDHGFGTVDFGKYIEWVCTCPLTQLQLMIFAGPAVTSVGVWTTCRLTFLCLLTGAVASYVEDATVKSLFFAFSTAFYALMLYKLDIVVMEMSEGKDRLFWATKPGSRLFMLVATSWTVFPILWIMAPEGFNVSARFTGFKVDIATTIANAAVKLIFMATFQRVRVQTIREQTVEHEIRRSQMFSESQASDQSPFSEGSGFLRKVSPAGPEKFVKNLKDKKQKRPCRDFDSKLDSLTASAGLESLESAATTCGSELTSAVVTVNV